MRVRVSDGELREKSANERMRYFRVGVKVIIYIYIYIYRERERERERGIFVILPLPFSFFFFFFKYIFQHHGMFPHLSLTF